MVIWGGHVQKGSGSTGALIDTNSNSIPDVAETAPPAPDSSDNYIVVLTQYNDAGRAYRTTDNLGRIDERGPTKGTSLIIRSLVCRNQ